MTIYRKGLTTFSSKNKTVKRNTIQKKSIQFRFNRHSAQAYPLFARPHHPPATVHDITNTLPLYKSTAALMMCDGLALRTLGNSIFFQRHNTRRYRAIRERTTKVSIFTRKEQSRKNMRELVGEGMSAWDHSRL